MELVKNLDDFDDVQFIANEIVRQYIRTEALTPVAAYDYMATLGAVFIPEEEPIKIRAASEFSYAEPYWGQ